MGCFDYLKEIRRSKKQSKSSPVYTTSATTSSNLMSRSGDSNATKQISKSTGSVQSPRSFPDLYEEKAHNMRVFDYKELRNATNDFSRLLKIGEGGFGSVYKGLIRTSDGKGDKIEVAVKKLNQDGLQGHKQWLAEVQFLGVLEHPNLVKLIGYCAVDSERGPQRLLVYEFLPNKTLEEHLFNKGSPSLPWNTRLQIVLGAAEGLTYLHEGVELQVIYRDFKASNVLLDNDFKPKLSDFGLAREGPSEGDTHVSTAVMGTYGYAAPDYIETGHLTSKSDVWSFGVVLYEVLTGRHSLERNRPRYEQKLLDWVKRFPVESKRFSLILDPRLENRYSLQAAREVAKLADSCLSKLARDRPTMSDVVAGLKQAMQYTDLDGDVDPAEAQPITDSDNEKKVNEETTSESFKRRMQHLAKLRQGTNMIGRRRYMAARPNSETPV